MYVDVEKEDGYIRDACVFSDRNTINDHETLNIRYANGTLASFNLLTFAPREYGYFYFTGTKGRMEYGVAFTPKAGQTGKQGMAEMGYFEEVGKAVHPHPETRPHGGKYRRGPQTCRVRTRRRGRKINRHPVEPAD